MQPDAIAAIAPDLHHVLDEISAIAPPGAWQHPRCVLAPDAIFVNYPHRHCATDVVPAIYPDLHPAIEDGHQNNPLIACDCPDDPRKISQIDDLESLKRLNWFG